MIFGTGCATTEYVTVPCPEPLPLPKPPAAAMEHHEDRSRLPDTLTEMDVESALRAILRAHAFDIETLSTLEAKHKALVDYINGLETEQ